MTDKEIIKDLKKIAQYSGFTDDVGNTLLNALDLIKNQQAEIDELKHEREVLIEDIHHLADQINEQIEEIERLSNSAKQWEGTAKDLLISKEKQQAEIERLKTAFENSQKTSKYWNGKCTELVEELETAKAEVIKKFTERLCEGRVSNDPVVIAVKVQLKEMVGDDK